MVVKMIYKILLAVGIIIVGVKASAQDSRVVRVQCGPTKDVVESLIRDFGEKPIIYGKGPDGENGVMTLWVNEQTLTWTVITTHGERSCVIGGGQNLTVISRPKSNL